MVIFRLLALDVCVCVFPVPSYSLSLSICLAVYLSIQSSILLGHNSVSLLICHILHFPPPYLTHFPFFPLSFFFSLHSFLFFPISSPIIHHFLLISHLISPFSFVIFSLFSLIFIFPWFFPCFNFLPSLTFFLPHSYDSFLI